MDRLRSVVRPIVTVAAFGVWSVLVLIGRAGVQEFIVMASSVIAYWFGGRNGKGDGGK